MSCTTSSKIKIKKKRERGHGNDYDKCVYYSSKLLKVQVWQYIVGVMVYHDYFNLGKNSVQRNNWLVVGG